ncbi:MAG: hypothetical protein R3Y53_10785, partial [Bacillota bacterium]
MDKFHIATGKSRFETYWKNKTTTWKHLIDFLSQTTITRETQGEYFNMTKMEQDKIKDVGGFVGGKLKDGKRRANSIVFRSIEIPTKYCHFFKKRKNFKFAHLPEVCSISWVATFGRLLP